MQFFVTSDYLENYNYENYINGHSKYDVSYVACISIIISVVQDSLPLNTHIIPGSKTYLDNLCM
jgi:hypothetical protein